MAQLKMSPGLSGTKDAVLPSSSRPVVQLLIVNLGIVNEGNHEDDVKPFVDD